ncbi:MAG TPA: glycoside hydrolase family 99-like domain-containing protein [Bacteroidales bacterium]|nr:glycoside hydrolase family 99-like domain-containing protein [Bacteroidales bacterium]HRZ48689.1 glycoside hydrolase family 99-like domain-containing protein [Bacteroidales bacterium]
MNKKARLIAFYLPQFHPIPENDEWWGKGFTEWTNVTKAKPLFKKHIQPKLPADLGFYDLRIPEVRELQAQLAAKHGIEGFCYWHYWLGGGKRLLERPFQEVLESGKPDFPFCLGWANHSWQGKGWMGSDACFIEQKYLGKEDAKLHFKFLLRAFEDKRYLRVNDNPLLVIYRPNEIPDGKNYLNYWRELAQFHGIGNLFIIGDTPLYNNEQIGLDGVLYSGQRHLKNSVWEKPGLFDLIRGQKIKKVCYKEVIPHLIKPDGYQVGEYPVIIPNWDTTPRLNTDAMIFYDNNPELFREHVKQILDKVSSRSYSENIIFIRSWNEWAEGNYLEPDQEFGDAYLRVLKQEIEANQ